jgi:hypothetical protein
LINIQVFGHTGKSGLTALLKRQKERVLPCQLGDSIQQPFSYWLNALTTRLPAAHVHYVLLQQMLFSL